MIGIDTNVLVRYIVQDDPGQAEAATRFIEDSCTVETPGFVNHGVLCELSWVLQRCYKASRRDILKVIEQILRTEQFQVQGPQVVWQALNEAWSGKADFADYINLSINRDAGCEKTATFDMELHDARGVIGLNPS